MAVGGLHGRALRSDVAHPRAKSRSTCSQWLQHLQSKSTTCGTSIGNMPDGSVQEQHRVTRIPVTHVIHIWSVETRAAHGRRTCFASEENFSSSHAGSLTMKKSRSLFCSHMKDLLQVGCNLC